MPSPTPAPPYIPPQGQQQQFYDPEKGPVVAGGGAGAGAGEGTIGGTGNGKIVILGSKWDLVLIIYICGLIAWVSCGCVSWRRGERRGGGLVVV